MPAIVLLTMKHYTSSVTRTVKNGYPKMLTETGIRAAKSRERPYEPYDERGLFMRVSSMRHSARRRAP